MKKLNELHCKDGAGIDKISSLSCQKVADSITSSKMGNNVAKQASVLLRNIPEYILHDIISDE